MTGRLRLTALAMLLLPNENTCGRQFVLTTTMNLDFEDLTFTHVCTQINRLEVGNNLSGIFQGTSGNSDIDEIIFGLNQGQ